MGKSLKQQKGIQGKPSGLPIQFSATQRADVLPVHQSASERALAQKIHGGIKGNNPDKMIQAIRSR